MTDSFCENKHRTLYLTAVHRTFIYDSIHQRREKLDSKSC